MGTNRVTARTALLAAVALSLVATVMMVGQPAATHPTKTIPSANNSAGEENMSTAESKNVSARRVEHAETASFEAKVLQSSEPVLVDFYADWCGPCRMLAPVLEDLARELPSGKVVKVNVDHSPELASAYRISSIPSVMVFKDGQVTARHVGMASKDRLKAMLTR
jgi:thioredoxin 1